jgi:hypothetical protein
VVVLGSSAASPAHAGAFDWATGPSIDDRNDEPGERDWSVSVIPYLWLAGVTGDVTTAAGATASGSSTFQEYGSNLKIGVEGVIDLRWRRWHVISDGTWMKLEGGDTRVLQTPGPVTPILNLGVITTSAFGTAGVAYELPLKWDTAVDLYMAGRWWHFTSYELATLGPLATSANSKTVWGDVVGGFRLRHAITEHWGVGLGADVGGGGSDVTWQTYASLKYMFNRHFGLGVGYRVLGVDYSSGGNQIDLTMRGLVLGIELAI